MFKIVHFAEMWVDPETVIQNEVSTKPITSMWKLEKIRQMNLFTKAERETDVEDGRLDMRGEEERLNLGIGD